MSRILWTSLLAGVLGSSLLMAQETKIKRVPARPTSAIQGEDLFRTYCAVCHGTNAKGGGPAAAALKIPPTDLTQLAAKNRGKYPELRVQWMLSDEQDATISAHGSAEMPIWGTIFRRMESNPDVGTVRIYNLTKYLETLQSK